jgi:hypothetical protein
VYFTAWVKGGGRVAVMEPMRVLAIATNPTNPDGPDADPAAFRRLVADAVPGVPHGSISLPAGAPPAPAAVDEPPKPLVPPGISR